MFRFSQGEPGDPIDSRSFSVAVDGADRTGLFQVAAGEAWGPIAAPSDHLELGLRQIAARICSSRGACAEIVASVAVVPASTDAPETRAGSRRQKLIDALLSAARKLFAP